MPEDLLAWPHALPSGKRIIQSIVASTALKYVLLISVISAAYYPSLSQVARADQLNYLYTTRDKQSLFALTLGTYSWNREINGDIHFFRPVLFILLGLEQWAFGPAGFWGWQLVSLLLHLTVVVLLYRLLQRWHGKQSWLTLLMACFFGVQYASMELVAWHHLSGYLFFCVVLLATLHVLARCAESMTRGRQWSLVLLVVLACFTLELGTVLAVLVIAYILCFNLGRKWTHDGAAAARFHYLTALGVLAAPALYTAANLTDQCYRYGRPLAGPALEGCLSPGAGLAGMMSATGLWLQAGLLPAKVDLGVDSRMSFVAIRPTLSLELAWQGAVALAALIAFLVLLATTWRRRSLGKGTPLGVFALAFGLGFTAIIVFLRAGPRGLMNGLLSNSYYAYLFNLSAVIFLAGQINLRERLSRAHTLAKVGLGSALLMIAVNSGWRVFQQGQAQAEWSKDMLILAQQLKQLHRAAGGDNGFNYCVAPDHPGERVLPYVTRSPLDGHEVSFAEALFPHHYSRVNPRYVLLKRHLGFDLLKIDGQVIGIPRKGWPADLGHFDPSNDARCIIGASAQEVEMAIETQRRNQKKAFASR